MADFLLSLKHIGEGEGGYVKNPETYKGVSRKKVPQWLGWSFIDSVKGLSDFPRCLEYIEALQAKVRQFYQQYWDMMLLSQVHYQPVANIIYDMSFPIGVEGTSTLVQKAIAACGLSINIDGKIGGLTIKSLNVIHPEDFITEFGRQCSNHFYQKAMLEPGDREFLNGWLNRLDKHLKGVV